MIARNSAILELREISKRYGTNQVVGGVDLTVPAGGFFVLYGPPASGKTVLMRIVMGLEQASGGSLFLRGADISGLSAAERNIGYVPQSFALYPHISVFDNIAYPLKLAKVGRREAEPVVRRAAEMLKITDLLSKCPDQLSGGQKQRVAIARGIAKQTDLFVLDDPLAGLDFKLREQLIDDLRQLQVTSGITFLYTTSDAIEALTLADMVGVLDGGRVVEVGPPEAIYQHPAHAASMRLLGFPSANFLHGSVSERETGQWCDAGPFTFSVTLAGSQGVGEISVGLRPEAIRLGARRGSSNGLLRLPATVLLREDLGGEEILYLEIDGTPLITVVRHDAGEDHGAEQLAITVDPRDLLLFAADGARIGQGTTIHG